MTDREIMEKAIKAWGKNPQLLQCLEEMAELQKEIIKNMNRGKDNLKELIDEITDVEIMVDQLKLIYNVENEVAAHRKEKMARLEGYLV